MSWRVFERSLKLPSLDIGRRIDVETSQEPDLTEVVRAIRSALDD